MNKKTYKWILAAIVLLLLILIIEFGVLISLNSSSQSADSTSSENTHKEEIQSSDDTNKEKTSSQETNIDPTQDAALNEKDFDSLRDIVGEKEKYYDQEVLVGPLKVLRNTIKDKMFWTKPSLGTDQFDYDKDADIDIFYGKVSDTDEWLHLNSEDYPIIYVKGIVRKYSNNSNVYIEATVIDYTYETLETKAVNLVEAEENNTDNIDDVVIQCAKTVIYESLKAPSTASWGKAEILDKDQYGRYLVEVVVDAQNSFGAMIRNQKLVVLKSVEPNGHFSYDPYSAMMESTGKYTREQAIEVIKTANNWNEPKEETQSAAGEESSKEESSGEVKYLHYSNARYGFSIDYPSYLTNSYESDNGDGITLTNEDESISLIAYGSHNIENTTAEKEYVTAVNNTPDVLYKVSKEQWYVIQWQEGDTIYYQKSVVGQDDIYTFLMTYPAAIKKDFDPTVLQTVYDSFKTPVTD